MRRLRRALGVSLCLWSLAGATLPARAKPQGITARTTWYAEQGWTAGGWYTQPWHTAACGYGIDPGRAYDARIPSGIAIVVNGYPLFCEDRGQLGTWQVDINDPSGSVPAVIGDYATLEVLDWQEDWP